MTIQRLIEILQTRPPEDTVYFSTAGLNTECIHPKNVQLGDPAHVAKGKTIIHLKPKLEKAIGFEITLDADDDGCCEYFTGYCEDNVGEEGCCEEDPLPYDDAVRVCGILEKHGIHGAYIEGNGGWAVGMIQETDFTRYAFSDDEKKERQRISRIYWTEADPRKLAEMLPKWEEAE